MDKKNSKLSTIIAIIVILIFLLTIAGKSNSDESSNTTNGVLNIFNSNSYFKLLVSQENSDIDGIIREYAKEKNFDIEIEYAGTLDIMSKLNSGEEYDAVWVSNSIWLYMLNNSVSTSSSINTSPVIFGITKSKAQELGFIGTNVYMQDIVNAIRDGKLKFSMSNPTTTNSGATAYLGMLQVLAGNPEVLKQEDLENERLKEDLKDLFSGLERSTGSDDFLLSSFMNGDYEAVITYEQSIIELNKRLISAGKEPLYAIYPVDGVSLNDCPFAYIDHKDENKKEIYNDLKDYLLSDNGQAILQENGRRTWYGGVNTNVDKTVFNPDWGIDTTKYITPIKYPSTAVIKKALNLYQTELRKPVHVVFCLDYSGSMAGTGTTQLVKAMKYICGEEAANDFIQFTDKDVVDILPFASSVEKVWHSSDFNSLEEMVIELSKKTPNGGTALFDAAEEALKLVEKEDTNKYNVCVVLMTDGLSNRGSFKALETAYKRKGYTIPVYSIMFGSASETELNQIAELTNAKVFDGKEDLVKAFKEVRGYN